MRLHLAVVFAWHVSHATTVLPQLQKILSPGNSSAEMYLRENFFRNNGALIVGRKIIFFRRMA